MEFTKAQLNVWFGHVVALAALFALSLRRIAVDTSKWGGRGISLKVQGW